MDFVYEQATKRPTPKADDSPLPNGLTHETLLQLVVCLERELDGREQVIARLKEERTKMLLFDARYARVCPFDPFHALSRDGQSSAVDMGEISIEDIYGSQLDQLDRMIAIFNSNRDKSCTILKHTESRLKAALSELEGVRSEAASSVSSSIVSIVDSEKNVLKSLLDESCHEVADCKKELAEMDKKLEEEREKHKKIIVFLMNERKELLSTMADLQMRRNSQPTPSVSKADVDGLRRELETVRAERDALKYANKTLKNDVATLKELARDQDERLSALRVGMNTMKAATPREDDSLVVANRVAMGVSARPLPSSSSFPTDKSRLPRVPVPATPAPRPSSASLAKPVASKKVPAMGTSTVRRATSSVTRPSEHEVQLNAAIDSLTAYTSTLVRSSSLTRGKSEPRGVNVDGKGTSSSPSAVPTPSTTLPTKLPSRSDFKSQSTKTKNSLLRAFGK